MNDNEGRRKTIRDWITHDPIYRRLKDVILLVLAIKLGVFSHTGLDLNWLFDKSATETKTETRDRSSAREGFIKRLDNLEDKVDRLDRKMDQMLFAFAAGGGLRTAPNAER